MKHSLLFCFALFTLASCVHGVLYEPPFCSAQCRDPTNFISDLPTDYGPYANGDNRAYAWAILALIQTKLNYDKISPPGAARIATIVGTCLYEGAALTEQNYASSVGATFSFRGYVPSEIKDAALDGAGYWALRNLFSDTESFSRVLSQYESFAGMSLRPLIPEIESAVKASQFTLALETYAEVNRRTAARAGAAACELVLKRYTSDGFTPRGAQESKTSSTPYRTKNSPQVRGGVTDCDAEIRDLNSWQALCVPRRPDGFDTTDCKVEKFLYPWAGRYTPYALQRGNEYSGRQLTSPPPRAGSAQFRREWEEVLAISGRLGDREKIIAEYWEDGKFTTQPPGHLWKIAANAALYERLSPAETARLLFIVGNALNDAGIACWRTKTTFDFIRPLQMIQCGEYRGKYTRSWLGPYLGVGITSINQWRPYQSPTFITPPFAGYTSGHSTFSAAAAEAMRLFFGSDKYRGPSCERVREGESKFEPRSYARPGLTNVPNRGPGTPGYSPAEDVVLCWNTFSEAAAQSGQSRLYGGIHIRADDDAGQTLGRRVGRDVFRKASRLLFGRQTFN